MPTWLSQLIDTRETAATRRELEAKFIIRKTDIQTFLERPNLRVKEIEQLYLDYALVQKNVPSSLLPPEAETYTEWRIRKQNDEYRFTAKRADPKNIGQRDEYESPIKETLFKQLKTAAQNQPKTLIVCKTRYTQIVELAQQQVAVEVDDYHITGAGEQQLDFITCEVEVPDVRLLTILLSGQFYAPQIQFLLKGIDVTGIKAFSNAKLANHGFKDIQYKQILDRLHQENLEKLNIIVTKTQQNRAVWIEPETQQVIHKINQLCQKRDNSKSKQQLIQNSLSEFAFGVTDSLGRIEQLDKTLDELDQMGKGWMRDYHVIISSDPYLRIHSKPQVFRPSIAHTDTTTRGAHTQDVVACSLQIARQLGLNAEMCMAIGALHDIGHPAGGHIGEQILYKLSGKRFKHHIYSLSLADIFKFNLLKEVQVGAFYHKSGGKSLTTPPGKPQEYGVVRIADKICYTPWDLFDSIKNGYLKQKNIPSFIFDTLGHEPFEWIQTMIKSAVSESAEAYNIQFTKRSGDIFKAYEMARQITFKQVHPQIRWELLEVDMTLCYEIIQRSFPQLDTVAIMAYMTDAEVASIARLVERRPKGALLTFAECDNQGFGFIEIIKLLQQPDFDSNSLYYTSAKGAI